MPTDRQPHEVARPARQGTSGGLADPVTGRVLDGRYRIGPRIARGGMASVYEATDLRLDRVVAVKVMHVGLGDDEEFAARFVREARAAARLSHPNVVAVFDQGDDQGTVFLAMELVPGHTLRDVIAKEAPMSPSRALALVEPVVSALAAAHRSGIVHRDVKPENVLIADDGRVKVADFGLAKAVGTDTQHTATGGVLIGTVSYLAPELVSEGISDARADVYAVGVLLYELLTGAKPHEGESPIQVAYKHVHEDVAPPSRLVPSLPGYVDALVARATSRDRGLRPADAGVLLHHVHRVAHALAEGVREDPELTQDLAPLLLHPDTGEIVVEEPGPARPPGPGVDPGATGDHEPTSMLRTVSAPDSPVRAAALPGLPGLPDPRGPQPDAPASAVSPARPAGPARRRRWRGPVAVLLAVLLATTLGIGAWWYGWARYSTVPSVLEQGRASAVAELEDAGFEVVLGEAVYSNRVPEGRVVTAEPGAGSRALEGDEVTIVLSLGIEQYPVPELAGRTLEEARSALAEVELEVGRVKERFSETVPDDQVVRSTPGPGKELRPGAAVDLVVSKGRKPVNVGDWVGEPADEAQRTLERKGLVVQRNEDVFSDDVAAGDVVAQEPTGGTLFKGDTVTLTVSKGPELVEVPGVRAQGVDAARAQLESLGFVVQVENISDYLGLGYVFRTDPGAGELVPKGSTITLFLV
ncbi:serine/threonine-protein kinase [Nocardioides marinisabuli]|uniref:non-specific serine/threonine protein kinase n=1 Tax=Nocardioides marinisabuli TaxID=419476 RepID=A0A7Y9F4G3_9ACTN|nr:serine/threonine-protein kinase [Nocardioides marinisabuli]